MSITTMAECTCVYDCLSDAPGPLKLRSGCPGRRRSFAITRLSLGPARMTPTAPNEHQSSRRSLK